MLKSQYELGSTIPLSWSQARLFLLPRYQKPEDWSGDRGICLLNVLPKMYDSGLMVMLQDCSAARLDQTWHAIPLFGVEQWCKSEDMLVCIQSRVSEAVEWPGHGHVVVASTDIRQDFVFVTPQVVAERMAF